MNIAYTFAPGRGDTDLLLYELSQEMQSRGYRACGTVQINTRPRHGGPCDMDVRVLPDGPLLRISQDLGAEARGCRLDPAALEMAVAHVEASLVAGADFLLVNKFGKHEAEGRGFRAAIAEALSRDIPVLVGLNRLNQQAFVEFSGGEAVSLAPERQALLDWLEDRIQRSRNAA